MSSAAREWTVVTGGAGFIGSHLAAALVERGRRVRVVDDFSTGHRSNLPSGIELVEGDIGDIAGRAVEGADVVYHLAAIPSVPKSIDAPLQSHRATAESTLAVLGAAARTGVRRVVYASSSAVYGDTPTLPKREDMPPRPLSPYAVAKLSGELYAESWTAHARLETVSLRFFNVYGPRQDPASPYAAVIPIFLQRLREKQPLPIYGDGRQTRDFTFVDDVVKGLLAAGTAAGASGRVYNIAGGRGISLLELADALARILGVRPEIDFRPPRSGDIRDSFADIVAARRDLGFSPDTPLETGLRKTWEWVRA